MLDSKLIPQTFIISTCDVGSRWIHMLFQNIRFYIEHNYKLAVIISGYDVLENTNFYNVYGFTKLSINLSLMNHVEPLEHWLRPKINNALSVDRYVYLIQC